MAFRGATREEEDAAIRATRHVATMGVMTVTSAVAIVVVAAAVVAAKVNVMNAIDQVQI